MNGQYKRLSDAGWERKDKKGFNNTLTQGEGARYPTCLACGKIV